MPRPLFDERTKMLWRVGFINPLDLSIVALLVLSGSTLLAWKVFGSPNAGQLALGLASMSLGTLVWLVILVFRCSWFVLQLLAEQKNLPAAAARLVLQFTRTGELPKTS